jgi:hypothetical protein
MRKISDKSQWRAPFTTILKQHLKTVKVTTKKESLRNCLEPRDS